MDIKLSHKEERYQPEGLVEVLKDNVFDIYPLFDNPINPRLITDIEIITSIKAELLNRGMFAIVKQRGLDPVSPEDGIQWAEAILGEVSGATIVNQVTEAVSAVGSGVTVTPTITTDKTTGKSTTEFKVYIIEETT